MAEQLVHYSATPLGPIRSVAQAPGCRQFKPFGLWVSDDSCEDNWRAFCEGAAFRLNRLACAHDVVLSDRANILRLSSARDIDEFTKEYGAAYDFMPERPGAVVRWHDVAETYDGILITPYIWERRLADRAFWYYSWDCACGCIWNASAIAGVTLRSVSAGMTKEPLP